MKETKAIFTKLFNLFKEYNDNKIEWKNTGYNTTSEGHKIWMKFSSNEKRIIKEIKELEL